MYDKKATKTKVCMIIFSKYLAVKKIIFNQNNAKRHSFSKCKNRDCATMFPISYAEVQTESGHFVRILQTIKI